MEVQLRLTKVHLNKLLKQYHKARVIWLWYASAMFDKKNKHSRSRETLHIHSGGYVLVKISEIWYNSAPCSTCLYNSFLLGGRVNNRDLHLLKSVLQLCKCNMMWKMERIILHSYGSQIAWKIKMTHWIIDFSDCSKQSVRICVTSEIVI